MIVLFYLKYDGSVWPGKLTPQQVEISQNALFLVLTNVSLLVEEDIVEIVHLQLLMLLVRLDVNLA